MYSYTDPLKKDHLQFHNVSVYRFTNQIKHTVLQKHWSTDTCSGTSINTRTHARTHTHTHMHTHAHMHTTHSQYTSLIIVMLLTGLQSQWSSYYRKGELPFLCTYYTTALHTCNTVTTERCSSVISHFSLPDCRVLVT